MRSLFVLAVALSPAACITLSNPGEYSPRDRPEPTGEPVSLRVVLSGFSAPNGLRTEESERVALSFAKDLRAAKVFASPPEAKVADLMLEGVVLRLDQPQKKKSAGTGDNSDAGRTIDGFIYTFMAIGAILGAPTDCGSATAGLSLRARDTETGAVLREWQSEVKASDCAGLYYSGWPLAKALSQSAGEVIEAMRVDAPAMKKRLALAKSWRERYGLKDVKAATAEQKLAAAIAATADKDVLVRVRAFEAIFALRLEAATPDAAVALRKGLLDKDALVRSRAVRAIEASGLKDREILDALVKLCARESDRAVKDAAVQLSSRLEAQRIADAPAEMTLASVVPTTGERPIIAVFEVKNAVDGLPQAFFAQLADYLSAQLTAKGAYRVVPRDTMKVRLTAEKAKSYEACYDDACRIELGRELAAAKVLSSTVLRAADTCAITATIYDLVTEAAESAATARCDCSEKGFVDAMDELSTKLSAK